MSFSYKALLFDLSGVLYEGDRLIPGALEAGLQACLVRTGKFQPKNEVALPSKASIIDSVAQLF